MQNATRQLAGFGPYRCPAHKGPQGRWIPISKPMSQNLGPRENSNKGPGDEQGSAAGHVNGRASRRARDAGQRAVRIVLIIRTIIIRSVGFLCHSCAEKG